jgi:hypothetical protein
MRQGFQITESVVEVFVNRKLFFMLNSLRYEEVFTILEFTLGLSRLNVEIYERLLINLSTFIIYISENRGSTSGSCYYLNHRYKHLFLPICRLLLRYRRTFRRVKDKEAFKIVQLMIVHHIDQFSNEDILNFLDILGDAAFLNISLNKYIQELRFTSL